MDKTLEKQVALVTGAGRGLGKTIAIYLARAGASVCLVSRTRQQLDAVVEEIQAEGNEAMSFVADVSDRKAVEASVKQTEESFGAISVLVNNAGYDEPFGPIGIVDPDEWWDAQGVHVRGTLLYMHYVIPEMKKAGDGHIINMVSRAGNMVAPNLSSYCVAKCTTIRLTEHVDAESASEGIKVFAIQPGTIVTEMARHTVNNPDAKKWVPYVVDELATMLDDDPSQQLDRLGKQVIGLADGSYDALAGGYLDLEQDIDQLLKDKVK